MSKKEKWKMPEWMEKYRESINNTGGNSIEDLINNPAATVFSNAPLALIQFSVQSQVNLLMKLKIQKLIE